VVEHGDIDVDSGTQGGTRDRADMPIFSPEKDAYAKMSPVERTVGLPVAGTVGNGWGRAVGGQPADTGLRDPSRTPGEGLHVLRSGRTSSGPGSGLCLLAPAGTPSTINEQGSASTSAPRLDLARQVSAGTPYPQGCYRLMYTYASRADRRPALLSGSVCRPLSAGAPALHRGVCRSPRLAPAREGIAAHPGPAGVAMRGDG
jgi:hypothetical protein